MRPRRPRGSKRTASCASCHGEKLEGGVGPALSDPQLNTLSKNTKLTVGANVYVPLAADAPQCTRLASKVQYTDTMAYVLKYNGYPASSKELAYAGATGSKVVIKSK